MSLGYPPLRPRPDGTTLVGHREDRYGVPDLMLNGFQKVKSNIGSSQPLEFSEKHWRENKEKMDFAMLRNTQGIHAPLRLRMERQTAVKIQRLPCLHSSHLLLDSLTGKLDDLEMEDIFNNPADSEVMGQPHAMVERQLGLI